MKFLSSSFLPAIVWLIFASILFFIPGDQLPNDDLFALPNIDKLIHSFLFFVLCYLFYRPFRKLESEHIKTTIFFKISLASIIYGLLVEVIQKYYIVNRSFDLWDLFFDTLGSFSAYWWAKKYLAKMTYKK